MNFKASLFVLLLSGSSSAFGFQLKSPLQSSRHVVISDRNSNNVNARPMKPLNNFYLMQKTTKNTRKVATSLRAGMIAPEILTCLLPTCLGFYRSEYTVSYGYGFGTALTALAILRNSCSTTVTNPFLMMHAAALVFYGLRLNAFLFLRTLMSSRMQDFQKNIEERAKEKGNRWSSRAPFILSCSFLYYGLSASPLFFTSKLSTNVVSIPSAASKVIKALIGLQWFGFGLAALGDFTKTYVKQSKKDENFLVTSGIFSIMRHPNYTGEIIGWTANALCATVASYFVFQNKLASLLPIISNLAIASLGWIGIVFVLLGATKNLEARQKKDYRKDPKYLKWVQSSWSGWKLPAAEEPEEVPHLEVIDTTEDYGSGI